MHPRLSSNLTRSQFWQRGPQSIYSSAFELHLSLEVIDQLQAAAFEPDQADLGPAHKLNMLDAVVDCPAQRIVVYLQTEKTWQENQICRRTFFSQTIARVVGGRFDHQVVALIL